MQTPEQILAKQGVPIHSFIAAGVYINQTARSEEQYRSALEEIIGQSLPEFSDTIQARLTYAYFAQEYVRNYNAGKLVCVEELLQYASDKANHLIKTQPYHWASAEEQPEDVTFSDDGSIKRKKGWKRERAFELYRQNIDKSKKEIMSIFIEDIGMSRSGAQTYYYNAKNEIGSGTE